MNIKTSALLYTSALLLSAQAFGSQTSSDPIKQRQLVFEQIETLVEKAEDSLDGSETNWQQVEMTSQSLASHSHSLLTLFPTGSQQGSKAKENIWTEPEKFNQLLMQMDEGFQALYQASLQRSLTDAESGLNQAQDTCKSCHRSYRSRW